jgi:hypothetical protein
MADYTTYHFRAPDVATFRDDLKSVLSDAGIDPVERGIIEVDDEGSESLGNNFDVVPAGAWYITEPERDEDAEIIEEGTRGDYAPINASVQADDMVALIGSFTAHDAAKRPSEIPDGEKVGNGSHRIDSDSLSSPERVFA